MAVVEPSEKTLEQVKLELELCMTNTNFTGCLYNADVKNFGFSNTLLQLEDHELGPNFEIIRNENIIIKARTEKEAAVCFLGMAIDLKISNIISLMNGLEENDNMPSYFTKFVDTQNINEFTLNDIYNKVYPQEALLEKLHQLLDTANDVEFENIIKSGKVDINKPFKNGSYLLELSILKDSEYNTFIKILLENGVNVNTISTNKELFQLPWFVNPLCLAITNRRQDIVELLLKYGADVNFPFTSNERYSCFTTPLHTAATFSHARKEISFTRELIQENGWPEMVEKLLLLGADPLSRDDEGRFAIEYATDVKCINILKNAMDNLTTL